MRKFFYISALLLAVVACKSTAGEDGSGVPPEEFDKARQALERAEQVRASEYEPELMAEAYAAMENAQTGTKSQDIRTSLAEATDKANQAFDLSKGRYARDLVAQLEEVDAQLRKMEADKYEPSKYRSFQSTVAESKQLIEAGDFDEGLLLQSAAFTEATKLKRDLREFFRWIEILVRDTRNYLATGAEEEIYKWSGDEYRSAEALLERGQQEFDDYQLKPSEASLLEARFLAKSALTLGKERQRQEAVDRQLQAVLSDLENSSTLDVLNEEGQVVDGTAWSGRGYLEANPLKELEAQAYDGDESKYGDFFEEEAELIEEEEEELQEYYGSTVSSDLMETKEEPMGSPLEMAKELWRQAVVERNEGNYDKAEELLVQADAYLAVHKASAVGKTYTVVRRPVNTDSLWRISGYDFIYDNPFLWPLIWERNQKDIPNPDLIYPGQVLVIPPLKP